MNNTEKETTELGLDTPIDQLNLKLIEEKDPNELDTISKLFNINLKKKELIRAGKLSDLQDMVTDQMYERISKKADEFDNQDLLGYFKTINDTLTKSKLDTTELDKPSLQINQNQVNINIDNTLNRESKEKVLGALKSIFNRYSKEDIQDNVIEGDTVS